MNRLIIPALIALGLVISHGFAYYRGHSSGVDSEQRRHAEEVENWRTNADAAYGLYMKAKDQKTIEYRTITKTVEATKNEIHSRAECDLDPRWLRVFKDNAAVANSGASSAPMPPGTGSPGWSDLKRSDPVRP